RSDPDAPKHKGISLFVLDMKSPGVTIAPLVNMAGEASFNQVFFDNVRIPRENLVGELHRGWYYLATALDFERSGIHNFAMPRFYMERFGEFASAHRDVLARNPALRYQMADRWIEIETGYHLAYRVTSMQAAGKIPNYEASVSKTFGAELIQRVGRTGMAL